jgi:hypothetical protein
MYGKKHELQNILKIPENAPLDGLFQIDRITDGWASFAGAGFFSHEVGE